MNRQEFEEKLERGIAQVRAGQGIVKTMEELERMAEETRIAQLQPGEPLRPGGEWGVGGGGLFQRLPGCVRLPRHQRPQPLHPGQRLVL